MQHFRPEAYTRADLAHIANSERPHTSKLGEQCSDDKKKGKP